MYALQLHAFPHFLIPGDKNINLGTSKESVKVLNTLTGLFGLAIQALKKLKQQELSAFDSLATDCSCHLRALMLANIGQELAHPQSSLKQELKQSIQKLKAQQLLVKQAGVDVTSWCQKGKSMKGELASIANAYGAGLAEVCGVVDQVVSLKERETVLEQLKQQAKTLVITKGADPQHVRMTSLSILPFAYTTEALAKVVVTASGVRKSA